jgi:hypothetical protein
LGSILALFPDEILKSLDINFRYNFHFEFLCDLRLLEVILCEGD